MTKRRKKTPPPPPSPGMVREPVQVYLAEADRSLLDAASSKAGLSRAELLRRGLRRVGAEIMHDESPMLRFLDDMTASAPDAGRPQDIAERHDDHLADLYLDRHTGKGK